MWCWSTSLRQPEIFELVHEGLFVWHTAVVDDTNNDNVTVNPDEVLAPGETEEKTEDENTDYISQPAKVMRIGSKVKSLLDEADERSKVSHRCVNYRRVIVDGQHVRS